MARRVYTVQHFIACSEVSVALAGPDSPYTIRDALFIYNVPADREWPVRLDELWVFARFMNLDRPREFYVRVVWMDAIGGEDEVSAFPPWVVRPHPGKAAVDRGWRIDATPFPGPGRYRLELCTEPGDRVLANEYIQIRRAL